MGELKKTFGAGLAVLIILLLAPYYLQLIGYTQETELSVVSENKETSEILITQNDSQNDLTKPEKKEKSLQDPINNSINLEKLFVIETPLYTAQISNFGGGSFTHYNLKGYSGAWVDDVYVDSLGVALLSDNIGGCAPCVSGSVNLLATFDCSFNGRGNQESVFLEDGEFVELVCRLAVDDIEIIKTTLLSGSSFVVNHHIVEQAGGGFIKYGLMWDSGIDNTEKNLYDDISYSGASVSYNEKIETLSFIPGSLNDRLEKKGSYSGTIDWAAIRNKYFIMALVPESPVGFAVLDGRAKQLTNKEVSPVYEITMSGLNPSQNISINTYFGPLDIDNINKLETTLDRIMNFGWFIIQPFSRGILWLLKFFHSFGINYGVILILFAFLVRFITGPLTKKSFESTQKMQAIQPQLKKMQEKYKNDSQKLNTEMVKMYRENGVNPLGGCFPMLLQMPLLFALFMVFRSTIEFRGAPFFWWIKDLSLPDTIFNLPFYIPVYGDQVAFLPILLGVSMFLTQKMSMANMEGGMGQQKYMMYFMSAFFFLIFNSFPSGLNLYYLVYNVLNYLQQKSLKKV